MRCYFLERKKKEKWFQNYIIDLILVTLEAATGCVLYKKVFLEISQISQENLQASGLQLY